MEHEPLEEQLDALERIVSTTHVTASWWFRLTIVMTVLIIITFVISGITFGTAITVDHNTHRISREVHRDQIAQLGECRRVQELRDRVNDNSHVIYQQLVLLRSIVGEPSLLRQLDAVDRVGRIAGVRQLDALSLQIKRISPTDCAAALAHPLSYQAPQPTPFAK